MITGDAPTDAAPPPASHPGGPYPGGPYPGGPYPGGKGGAGVYQAIINEMPPHDVYLEPFVGGGAVLRAKRPAALSVVADLDPAVVDRYRGLDGVEAHHGCGIALLRSRRWTGRELVYADPPYVRDARKSQRDLYDFEMTDEDHERLLDVLVSLPCPVLVSGYPSALYARWLHGWRVVTFTAMTRRGPAVEWLWCNFAPPVALHDYRYLGRDYRERERIKKKVTRWRDNLAALPGHEQQAILSALLESTTAGGDGAAA